MRDTVFRSSSFPESVTLTRNYGAAASSVTSVEIAYDRNLYEFIELYTILVNNFHDSTTRLQNVDGEFVKGVKGILSFVYDNFGGRDHQSRRRPGFEELSALIQRQNIAGIDLNKRRDFQIFLGEELEPNLQNLSGSWVDMAQKIPDIVFLISYLILQRPGTHTITNANDGPQRTWTDVRAALNMQILEMEIFKAPFHAHLEAADTTGPRIPTEIWNCNYVVSVLCTPTPNEIGMCDVLQMGLKDKESLYWVEKYMARQRTPPQGRIDRRHNALSRPQQGHSLLSLFESTDS